MASDGSEPSGWGSDTRPGLLWAVCILGAVLTLGGIIAVLLGFGARSTVVPPGPEGAQQIVVRSREHTDKPVAYDRRPPVGGDHAQIWVNCGVYDVAVPPELAVHSMEHGAVWVTHPPAATAGQIKKLGAVVKAQYVGKERYIILSPFDGQSEAVILSAWGRQLRLANPDDPRLAEFLQTFAGGPQSPEPRFPCASGGVGEPKG